MKHDRTVASEFLSLLFIVIKIFRSTMNTDEAFTVPVLLVYFQEFSLVMCVRSVDNYGSIFMKYL